MTATSIPTLLHYEDRDSMAHSVESRVPFLDYRLVEFVLGLPDEFKLSNGVTKRVLREGMSGLLPDTIRDRMDKLGFVTPEEVWVKEHAPDLFQLKLQRAVDSSQGILSPKCLELLDEVICGAAPFSFLIWRMISFGEWMETFSVINGGDCQKL
ncbi:MAG: asparagine synthase-related protein [Smithella sp.]